MYVPVEWIAWYVRLHTELSKRKGDEERKSGAKGGGRIRALLKHARTKCLVYDKRYVLPHSEEMCWMVMCNTFGRTECSQLAKVRNDNSGWLSCYIDVESKVLITRGRLGSAMQS